MFKKCGDHQHSLLCTWGNSFKSLINLRGVCIGEVDGLLLLKPRENQWCTGKVLKTGWGGRKLWFAVFADFLNEKTPTVADFILLREHHVELGIDVLNQLLQTSRNWSSIALNKGHLLLVRDYSTLVSQK